MEHISLRELHWEIWKDMGRRAQGMGISLHRGPSGELGRVSICLGLM
jgi:hypothetical protein